MGHFIDLTGHKYGRLTVKSLSKVKQKTHYLWNCVCDCGNKTRVRGTSLRTGNTKSCGCLNIEAVSGANGWQAKRSMATTNGTWVPCQDEWYQRTARLMFHAKRNKIPVGFKSVAEFTLHIKEILPEKCPVFNKKLIKGNGKPHDWSPSIDKIDPQKGYVKGNIQIISMLANTMKNHADKKQLKQFASWVLETV
jgi:hypothetical protein